MKIGILIIRKIANHYDEAWLTLAEEWELHETKKKL